LSAEERKKGDERIMNEQRLMLIGKREELRLRHLQLKARGSAVIKKLQSGLNLNLHDKIENLEIAEIEELSGELTKIHTEITKIKTKVEEITEEIGDGKNLE
jgi:uncharacterized coiled-coil protein SlyX